MNVFENYQKIRKGVLKSEAAVCPQTKWQRELLDKMEYWTKKRKLIDQERRARFWQT